MSLKRICRKLVIQLFAVAAAISTLVDGGLLAQTAGDAPDNAIARLGSRLASGAATLVYTEGRGYLPSLLDLLGIDVDSQVLVFSKTSFQHTLIDPTHPRALYFNARILVMDEPCAALGPEETRMVGDLVRQLKADGVGIFLISHDMQDVFALSDRLAVMKNGRLVGTYRTQDVTEDEVLGMIILGKQPDGKVQAKRAGG